LWSVVDPGGDVDVVLGLMTGSELVALGVIFVGKRIHSCGLFSGYFVSIVNRGLGYA
jgi:hypothetical protein